ncbi:ABC transporter permease [Boseongicola aestuarii]|uniref:Molybdenum transport system permease protein ModB n=1 Tax=Boseongicola aestuarii TaxID=1470561 RepID=A0A238J5L9_9RHOB|nr:iron ABC transporter permease [Boseongicola aestuarii]SMX25240.1 Molybdenum transport system permease protein ModB [Boseongicola aestuarii]
MTNEKTQLPGNAFGWPSGWSLGASLIAVLVLMPILSVLWIAANPVENIWPHLMATTLPRYLGNTLIVMASVAVLATVVGTLTAWLVVMYRFPGRRWLEWALLMPLAVPGFLGAYALVDFLDFSGPVQTGLREMFGWASAQDYVFPDIRSRAGAIFVLAASLYPYVYLLARAGFHEQSGAAHDVARALGANGLKRFWRVGLPLARPAIVAGTAIVMMETVNDFGTVDYFGVQTLTTGVFSVWLEAGNAGGAAQIATLILALIFALVALEKISRRKAKFHSMARQDREAAATPLSGAQGWLATVLCLVPFLFGFVLPVLVMVSHAITRPDRWFAPGLFDAFANTVLVGGAAAFVTVAGAIFMVYGVRLSGRALPRLVLPVTTIGYAAPGAVLAIGLLIPLAALDNAVADGVLALTGWDPGLMLTGGTVVLVYAYAVRFFAIGQGAADAAMGRVAPSLPLAARTLGQTAGGALGRIYLPLIRGSVAAALLLVFVDCVKELPATLLLRPFNFNTLATRSYEQASLERIADAAPSALLIICVSLVAVVFVARSTMQQR